jgi:ceramide glucosyltransferase
MEPGLSENLESFFHLDYPRYELLFSLADANDPAAYFITHLMAKYPRIRARLFTGEITVGPNPKVNNLVKSYRAARHDWILISDSNISVSRHYLDAVVADFTTDVGIVTALVAGSDPRGLGGWLEATFLNTFYARWMLLAGKFNNPVVLGKSMLFRRSEAQRFGGIPHLGRYLAEDYMAGQAMQMLGKRIVVMRAAVTQPIGDCTIEAFWSRHLRWGRIRRSQASLAFYFEPFISSSLFSGLLGAWAFHHWFAFRPETVLMCHLIFWLSCDLLMIRQMGQKIHLRSIGAWFLRESTHLPLWLHIMTSQTVLWRGQELRLVRGGVLNKA